MECLPRHLKVCSFQSLFDINIFSIHFALPKHELKPTTRPTQPATNLQPPLLANWNKNLIHKLPSRLISISMD